MTYYEWRTTYLEQNKTGMFENIFYEILKSSKFSYFNYWLISTFDNYNILFDPATFAKKIAMLTLSYENEIHRIYDAARIYESTDLSDNIGTTSTHNTESKATTSGKVTNSYSGYNVDNGEFNNSTNSTDSSATNEQGGTVVNYVDEIFKITNNHFFNKYDHLKPAFMQFFQCIY